MPAPGQTWPYDSKVIACVFHSFAISTGIFRTAYRCYISRFGWEDAWALLALLTDVVCLACAWLQNSASEKLTEYAIVLNWVITISFTCVLWEARLSMITTIIRIGDPRVSIRRGSFAVALAFVLMWMIMLGLKLYFCVVSKCAFNSNHDVAITQLITDAISDTLLVVMPILFLRGVKITRGQRVLFISSFASSICITILTIAHSITLFLPTSSRSLLVAHIKTALALFICNLLVLVTFAYRLLHKTDIDLSRMAIESDRVQFTSVPPGQVNTGNISHSTSTFPTRSM